VTALRAELHPFRLALKAPLVTGGVSIRFRAGFLVALSADGGTGGGEASAMSVGITIYWPPIKTLCGRALSCLGHIEERIV